MWNVAVGRAQGAVGGRSKADLPATSEIAWATAIGSCCEDHQCWRSPSQEGESADSASASTCHWWVQEWVSTSGIICYAFMLLQSWLLIVSQSCILWKWLHDLLWTVFNGHAAVLVHMLFFCVCVCIYLDSDHFSQCMLLFFIVFRLFCVLTYASVNWHTHTSICIHTYARSALIDYGSFCFCWFYTAR